MLLSIFFCFAAWLPPLLCLSLTSCLAWTKLKGLSGARSVCEETDLIVCGVGQCMAQLDVGDSQSYHTHHCSPFVVCRPPVVHT